MGSGTYLRKVQGLGQETWKSCVGDEVRAEASCTAESTALPERRLVHDAEAALALDAASVWSFAGAADLSTKGSSAQILRGLISWGSPHVEDVLCFGQPYRQMSSRSSGYLKR